MIIKWITVSFHAVYYAGWAVAGEIVQITKEGVKSVCVVPRPKEQPSAFCIFEYVYFARPDSLFEGEFLLTVHSNSNTVVNVSRH